MSTRHSRSSPSSPGRSKSSSRVRRSGACAVLRPSTLSGALILPLLLLLLRAHKEVLWFASPFFQAALSGNWAETGRPLSMSSVITISQPPIVPGDKSHPDPPTAMAFAPMDPDMDPEELDIDVSESSEPEVIESSPTSADAHGPESGACSEVGSRTATPKRKAHEAARQESLEKLSRNSAPPAGDVPRSANKEKGNKLVKLSWKRANASAKHHPATSNPDAVIVLKEEKVRLIFFLVLRDMHSLAFRRAPFTTFSASSIPGTLLPTPISTHTTLTFHLRSMECTITWNNVEGLMNIGNKLCVPSLQRICLNFLLTHAAGRPIKAMRIAELFEEEELYREASRFVLDNPGGWPEQELNTLSSDTLLKLEKR